jgi:hypothetical protein
MNVLAMILDGAKVVMTLMPITLEAAIKLKALFAKSGTNYTVEIREMQDQAVADANSTEALIAAWKKEHGYV